MIPKNVPFDQEYVKKIFFSNSARQGFEKILKFCKKLGKNSILLPSYIGETDREGSGIYDPVKNTEFKSFFYNLNNDLSVEIEDLEEKVKSLNIEVLLVVHYFGVNKNDLNYLQKICFENDIILIEDCAHCPNLFLYDCQLGKYGDFSFFSIHKISRAETGGGILVNNDNYVSNFSFKPNIDVNSLYCLFTSDFQTSKIKRIKNFNYMLGLFKQFVNADSLYDDIGFDTPHNFPFLVDETERESIYFKLIDFGVPVTSLYYRMILPIRSGNYSNTNLISKRILNLPIHEGISFFNIEYIIDKLKLVLDEK